MVQQLISLANNVLVISAPEKAKRVLPETEILENFFSWVRTVEMEPYQTEKIDRPLLSEEVISGRVIKTKKGKYGSTVWMLKNGIRVVVLPTTDTPYQIVMSGQASDSHGGLLFGFDARTGGECFGSRGFHCRAVTKGVG